MKITAVILAAGESSRMTGYKQLLTYKGKSLIQHLVAHLDQLNLKDIVCVTGHLHDEIITELSDYKVKYVHNEEYQRGMSSSIQRALKSIDTRELDAILFTTTDQPLIPLNHYQELYAKSIASTEVIIATSYKDTYGIPVVFKKEMFDELLGRSNEKGAKSIIKKHIEKTYLIKCDKAQHDIDTDEDYDNLINNNFS